jgi:dihydrofolate synthase / folylpolyglutamate synthase
MRSSRRWLESLSPWPEEFGLGRMHALLDELGHPERAFPAVHVVGSNGKSTAARTIAALLRAEGLRVGAYTSPHVAGWEERLDTDAEAFDAAVAGVRPAAERVGATQFEVLTATALAHFAEEEVDVAVVEAGLGGRLDATNVLGARVVHLTNVSLEHTDVLGPTREAIAREKLAVVRPGSTAVLGEAEWRPLVPDGARVVEGGAREAAEMFLGRRVDGEVEVELPGRFEVHGDGDEIWDGAHNPAGVEWLVERLPRRDYVVVASILRDKDARAMLERLAEAGRTLVAVSSSNSRALTPEELATIAEPLFERVRTGSDLGVALEEARREGPVLVTGSLYLLQDLASARPPARVVR